MLTLREAPLHALDNRLTTSLGVAIRECTRADETVAVDWAGVVPYFADRRTVDLLAKSDPVVARQRMHFEPELPIRERFWPGHLKWDFKRTLLVASPEVVVVLTGGFDRESGRFCRLTTTWSPRRFMALWRCGVVSRGGPTALRLV